MNSLKKRRPDYPNSKLLATGESSPTLAKAESTLKGSLTIPSRDAEVFHHLNCPKSWSKREKTTSSEGEGFPSSLSSEITMNLTKT